MWTFIDSVQAVASLMLLVGLLILVFWAGRLSGYQRKRAAMLGAFGAGFVVLVLYLASPSFMAARHARQPPPADLDLKDVIVTGRSRRETGTAAWNTWFEPGIHEKPAFAPAQWLTTKAAYSLFVHLSATPFERGGVTTTGIGPEVLEYLRKSAAGETEVLLYVVADPSFLRLPLKRSAAQWMRVNTERIRNLSMAQLSEYAAAHPEDPLLDFGTAAFAFNTTGKTGSSTISISIWVEDVPVQEISVDVCIKSRREDGSCDDSEVTSTSLYGLDSLRISSERQNVKRPDAALNFLEVGDSDVVGVLRCNVCDWPGERLISWRLGRSPDHLRKYLDATIRPSIEGALKTNNEVALADAGSDLYRTLFFDQPADARAAKRAFEAFLSRAARSPAADPSSLFVRFLSDSDDPPLYSIPIGLMRIPTGSGKQDFLGFLARLEQPMRHQEYGANTPCVSTWHLLVPPADATQPRYAEISRARAPISDWIIRLENGPNSSKVYQSIDAFRDWLDPGDSDVDWIRRVRPSSAIAVVGHHHEGRIYFDEFAKSPNITSSTVNIEFDSPSIAILSACGTAAPGAADFVAAFNAAGVGSVIATSTNVPPVVAGEFMRLLINNAATTPQPTGAYLGIVVHDTLRQMRQAHGGMPLVFSLYGNGAVRLCM